MGGRILTDIKNDAAGIGINLTPVIYTGASFAATWLDSTVAQSFPLWMANYNGQGRDTGSPNFNGVVSPWQSPNGWQFWQYTDAQSITGFPSTDADVFKGSTFDFNDYIVGAAPRWALNSRVTTNTSVDAWATSASNTTFTAVNSGVTGTIISGGIYGNSFWRWEVRFDNGVTGWVGEDFLNTATPTVATTPNPTNNITTNTLPTSFTWTAGANATSYNVYLDGVLKANVTGTSWAHTTISQGAHTWRVDSVNAELTTTGTTWNFTFDTVAPTISNVTSTAANGFYKAGAVIPITIAFSENVTVTGTPTLALNDGGSASYASGSGGSTLTFNYTVGAQQNTGDLDYASTSALALSGGTIKDTAGNAATLTLPSPGATGSLGFNKAIVIDTPGAQAPPTAGSAPNLLDTTLSFTVATPIPAAASMSAASIRRMSPSPAPTDSRRQCDVHQRRHRQQRFAARTDIPDQRSGRIMERDGRWNLHRVAKCVASAGCGAKLSSLRRDRHLQRQSRVRVPQRQHAGDRFCRRAEHGADQRPRIRRHFGDRRPGARFQFFELQQHHHQRNRWHGSCRCGRRPRAADHLSQRRRWKRHDRGN